MTNLSPQAQAIVDAYDSAPFVDYDIGDRVSIAAVLREVVNQLKYIGITEKNILRIADELEAL